VLSRVEVSTLEVCTTVSLDTDETFEEKFSIEYQFNDEGGIFDF
jgi:hypothetical protein